AYRQNSRRLAAWYFIGILSAALLLFAAVCSNGILGPLLRQMAWLSRNYTAANDMPYGAIIGGYRALFDGAGIWELPVRLWLVVCVALPAILPVFSAACCALLLLRRREDTKKGLLPYFVICIAALVASTYPRSDVQHLAYVAALPYAFTAILLY